MRSSNSPINEISGADKNLHGYFLEYQIHMDIILENIHVDSDFQYAVEL